MTRKNRGSLRRSVLLLLACGAWSLGNAREPETENPTAPGDRLDGILERFPESDADGNGKLSREEAVSFFRNRREGMETPREKGRSRLPAPTHAAVSYGDHEKQAFDLWLVPGATEPTPLVLFMHGGGFRSGDKGAISPSVVEECLAAGVAVAAMNYRLSDVGPYPMMMMDCARGLQTIRHRASEWRLNPEKVACYGGSAGAGISLWLGFHEDLADPDSEDPVARESTRIVAVGAMNGQTTYDINDFREWFAVPDLEPGPALPAFYGVETEADWESDRVRALMTDASSINHLTRDDVPAYLVYSRPNTVVTAETGSSEWVHHVKLGLTLQEAMHGLGLECIVTGPDVTPEDDPYGSMVRFLIEKVKG